MTAKLLLASVTVLTMYTADTLAQTAPPSLKSSAPGLQLRPTGLQVMAVVPGSTAARQGIELSVAVTDWRILAAGSRAALPLVMAARWRRGRAAATAAE